MCKRCNKTKPSYWDFFIQTINPKQITRNCAEYKCKQCNEKFIMKNSRKQNLIHGSVIALWLGISLFLVKNMIFTLSTIPIVIFTIIYLRWRYITSVRSEEK